MTNPYPYPDFCFRCRYYSLGAGSAEKCLHRAGEGLISSVDTKTGVPNWCPLRYGIPVKDSDLEEFSGLLGDAVRAVMRARA